jgi:hypothetical protein
LARISQKWAGGITVYYEAPNDLSTIRIRGDYNKVGQVSPLDGTGLDNIALNSADVSAVPEPTSLALCGIGALGMMFGARRRRQPPIAPA